MMIKTRLVFPPSDLRRPREQLLKSIVGGINALGDSNRPVLKAIIDEQAAAVSNSRPNEKPYAPLELWKLAIAMGTMMCTLCELGEVCLRQEDEDEGGIQANTRKGKDDSKADRYDGTAATEPSGSPTVLSCENLRNCRDRVWEDIVVMKRSLAEGPL